MSNYQGNSQFINLFFFIYYIIIIVIIYVVCENYIKYIFSYIFSVAQLKLCSMVLTQPLSV